MIRFLVNAAVYMVAAAIGFLVADMVLDDMSVAYPTAFLMVVVLFGLIQALISPLMTQITQRNATVLTGGVGLFSALIALIVTATAHFQRTSEHHRPEHLAGRGDHHLAGVDARRVHPEADGGEEVHRGSPRLTAGSHPGVRRT